MEKILISFVAIFGAIIGSFLNSLIWRWQAGESLEGRSFCPLCRKLIHWYDNLPILSFLNLKGRCRYCAKKISWQYPLVEAATALIFSVIFYRHFQDFSVYRNHEIIFFLSLLIDWLAAAALIIVFVYDWRWQLVPVTLLLPLTIALFFLKATSAFLIYQHGLALLTDLGAYSGLFDYLGRGLLLYALLAVAFFLLQYLLTKGRGIGQGDIWIGLALGIILPQANSLAAAILIAYLAGSLVGLALIAFAGKNGKDRLPLGVFLAAGAIVVMFFPSFFSNWLY